MDLASQGKVIKTVVKMNTQDRLNIAVHVLREILKSAVNQKQRFRERFVDPTSSDPDLPISYNMNIQSKSCFECHLYAYNPEASNFQIQTWSDNNSIPDGQAVYKLTKPSKTAEARWSGLLTNRNTTLSPKLLNNWLFSCLLATLQFLRATQRYLQDISLYQENNQLLIKIGQSVLGKKPDKTSTAVCVIRLNISLPLAKPNSILSELTTSARLDVESGKLFWLLQSSGPVIFNDSDSTNYWRIRTYAWHDSNIAKTILSLNQSIADDLKNLLTRVQHFLSCYDSLPSQLGLSAVLWQVKQHGENNNKYWRDTEEAFKNCLKFLSSSFEKDYMADFFLPQMNLLSLVKTTVKEQVIENLKKIPLENESIPTLSRSRTPVVDPDRSPVNSYGSLRSFSSGNSSTILKPTGGLTRAERKTSSVAPFINTASHNRKLKNSMDSGLSESSSIFKEVYKEEIIAGNVGYDKVPRSSEKETFERQEMIERSKSLIEDRQRMESQNSIVRLSPVCSSTMNKMKVRCPMNDSVIDWELQI